MWHWFQDYVADGKETVSGGWKKRARKLLQETGKRHEDTAIEAEKTPCRGVVWESPAGTGKIVHSITWWTFGFE